MKYLLRKRRSENEPERKKINNRHVITAAAGALVLLAAILLIAEVLHIYHDDLPSIEQLTDIEPSLITYIYANDGSVLQTYFNEKRILIPFDSIPKCMVDALLAAEDANFYDHWGISSYDLTRAVYKNITRGFGSQGASTISQQLARMLFLDREVSLMRKFREALTAIKIERAYSKNEILEMYLNQYWFGQRAYGIQAASRAYFSKRAEDLKIEEAALLAAILNAPSRYSPVNHHDRAKQRRSYVLGRMSIEGMISEEERDSLQQLPLIVNIATSPPGEAPYFTEIVRQYLVEKYGEDEVYSGGLHAYTSIDSRLQRVATQVVQEYADSLQRMTAAIWPYNDPDHTEQYYDSLGDSVAYRFKEVQAALVAIDNKTGDVISLVGGKDFTKYKFNNAVQALRSPGSAFKPFVYTAAIENGMRPCDIFYDNAVTINIPGQEDYRPHNFDFKFMGKMPLRDAFKFSRNVVAIKILQMIQPQQPIFFARKMGITSPLQPVVTLAIGTSEVTLLELTSAYSVFPDHGIHIKPRFVTKVIDRYGNVREDNAVSPGEEVLTPQTAYIMVNLMQSVIDDDGGTGHSVRWRGFLRPAGGKTGTSSDFSDNLFMGYTPQITTGVWVGFGDGFTTLGKNQTGAKNGLPIWTPFMIAAHDSLPVEDFDIPEGIIFKDICLETCELATNNCPDVRREVFTEKTVPKELCHIHSSASDYINRRTRQFNLDEPDSTGDQKIRF
ncbi:MAG: PBP1A family penicillin-binding protein [Candidatus Zixiibacteriota bacterium]